MGNELKCEYCSYEYHGHATSLLMLHLCSDQEYHFIDRIDLTEEPLKEVSEKEIMLKEREKRLFYHKVKSVL